MKKIYGLIVLSLFANMSFSFAMDTEEKKQVHPLQLSRLSYVKWHIHATWRPDTNMPLDVCPIVSPPSAHTYTAPLTSDDIICTLQSSLKKGSHTLATKLKNFITSLRIDDIEYDEEFEKEKHSLLTQFIEGLNEQDSALNQEEYIDLIISLSDGLIKSGLSAEEYFSRILATQFIIHLRI